MRHFFRLLIAIAALSSSSLAQVIVPQWAKDAIWYQMFPERFRNGDPANDPTRAELEMAAERGWAVSPWTSDWYKLQPWEEKFNGGFYGNVFERRYGGDIQGVVDKLDYLRDLGITAIYFNPVFDAISLHKYDASTYHHIDHTFGPNPRGDQQSITAETDDPATWKWTSADSLFLTLIKEAHRRGIRVIIDGVFNHSGTRFFAFQDIMKNQQRSRYASWYDVRTWDDPATPQNEFTYKGWWDVRELPEFWEGDSGFVKPVWNYFFNITKRWMDPNGDGDPSDGIDGWRLDVGNEVSHLFWKGWRNQVKAINPDAYIVGEIWDDASKWLGGDEFDAVMNYPFARAVVRFFIDTDRRHLKPSEFDRELAAIRQDYPGEISYVLQNLIDSHDTDRLGSMIMNPNRKYDDQNGLRNNPDYNVGKPTGEARQIQKLMLLFQMSYVGAPMIYYGDESGMWGADDPDDRKPMLWADLAYENERSHPIPGRTRTNDAMKFDGDLFKYYKALVRIRNENAALRRGDFTPLLVDDAKNIYAFRRSSGDNDVIVVINNGGAAQTANLKVNGVWKYRNELTGRVIEGKADLRCELNGKSGIVLVRMK
ncbi:MAG: glycoside hydrolase family 13 protein [Ignavibacteriales bacterium]|nr:glycoside hydrolase family 13 protein [Ignavibacteriales bacterium]